MGWRDRFDERNQRRADERNARFAERERRREHLEPGDDAPDDSDSWRHFAAEAGCCLGAGCFPVTVIAGLALAAVAVRRRRQ